MTTESTPNTAPSPGRRVPSFSPLLVSLIGAMVGAAGTAGLAVANPGLYIDWAAFSGLLIIVPGWSILLGVAVVGGLAIARRVRWSLVPLGALASLVAGEALYGYSLTTPFARWSAARYWQASAARAAEERAASDREVCRQVLEADRAALPPPAPISQGAEAMRTVPTPVPSGPSLLVLSPDSCRSLLERR